MNKVIDNVKFTKFFLRNKEISEEQKQKFMKAVPKMTEMEKAEIIANIRSVQLAEMLEDLRGKIADPLLSKEEVKKIEDEWAMEKHKEIVEKMDKDKIKESEDTLKQHSPPSHQPPQSSTPGQSHDPQQPNQPSGNQTAEPSKS